MWTNSICQIVHNQMWQKKIKERPSQCWIQDSKGKNFWGNSHTWYHKNKVEIFNTVKVSWTVLIININ